MEILVSIISFQILRDNYLNQASVRSRRMIVKIVWKFCHKLYTSIYFLSEKQNYGIGILLFIEEISRKIDCSFFDCQTFSNVSKIFLIRSFFFSFFDTTYLKRYTPTKFDHNLYDISSTWKIWLDLGRINLMSWSWSSSYHHCSPRARTSSFLTNSTFPLRESLSNANNFEIVPSPSFFLLSFPFSRFVSFKILKSKNEWGKWQKW